jgi:hypothetical protein
LSDFPYESLRELFEEDSRVQVAYLFGSKSRGSYTSESDTDIAVLLSELPENMLDYYLSSIEVLSTILGDRVDLVVLNTASSLLRHQVLKWGRVIYSRDEMVRVKFEARSEREYLDFNWYRERYDKGLLEDISKKN